MKRAFAGYSKEERIAIEALAYLLKLKEESRRKKNGGDHVRCRSLR